MDEGSGPHAVRPVARRTAERKRTCSCPGCCNTSGMQPLVAPPGQALATAARHPGLSPPAPWTFPFLPPPPPRPPPPLLLPKHLHNTTALGTHHWQVQPITCFNCAATTIPRNCHSHARRRCCCRRHWCHRCCCRPRPGPSGNLKSMRSRWSGFSTISPTPSR